MGGIGGQGCIKMVSANTHNHLMSLQELHFSPHSTAKTNDKTQISGRMASICISDVVTASVNSEKTRLKKLMKIIIINKSQETTVFSRAPEIDFRYETKARKSDDRLQVWCSIQVRLHREPPEVGGVKKVNRKFVLVGWSSVCQSYIESACYRTLWLRLRYTNLMIFMTKFPNFIFKESKQVWSTSLKDHIYTEVVVVLWCVCHFSTSHQYIIRSQGFFQWICFSLCPWFGEWQANGQSQ